ncbi:MAG TPA: transglycosylase SLT domain-containing protein [Thermodesulfobacteriota bacterium]|nr:transglycosylase SLT domain-containing protein [Thermodesulfobacteriota bacterium]
MVQKISLIGILLFLSSAGLSNVSAQTHLRFYLTVEEQLSNQQEVAFFHLQEGNDFNLEAILEDRGKKEPDFDIPIVINARVEQFIQCFQTTLREKFVTWLARSGKYMPFMKRLLKDQGLPEDLVYIALIESGFNPYAYSRSKAVGPWQFIYLTGKKYGLKVNWWVDERRDPEKSTIAAAKYLKDLYETFACWYLAAAGYNAGEYKIVKAMKRYRTEDFWTLTKVRYLKRETKDYVPLMIAAALVAKDPEKYGFTDVEYQKPLRYEKVRVPELTGLSVVANACEASLEEIKDLNPELRRGVTPPNENDYEIKIPFGRRDLFEVTFHILQAYEKFEFKTHLVKKGETLKGIAKLYRVDLEPLLELNHLTKATPISKGTILSIPISKDEEIKPLATAQKKSGKSRDGSRRVK